MEILILLLCISGISMFLTQIDGPFELLAKARRFIFPLPLIGTFLYSLIACPFCIGMQAGWITYLIYAPHLTWSPWELIVWSFAGGTSNLLLETWLSKTYERKI